MASSIQTACKILLPLELRVINRSHTSLDTTLRTTATVCSGKAAAGMDTINSAIFSMSRMATPSRRSSCRIPRIRSRLQVGGANMEAKFGERARSRSSILDVSSRVINSQAFLRKTSSKCVARTPPASAMAKPCPSIFLAAVASTQMAGKPNAGSVANSPVTFGTPPLGSITNICPGRSAPPPTAAPRMRITYVSAGKFGSSRIRTDGTTTPSSMAKRRRTPATNESNPDSDRSSCANTNKSRPRSMLMGSINKASSSDSEALNAERSVRAAICLAANCTRPIHQAAQASNKDAPSNGTVGSGVMASIASNPATIHSVTGRAPS